MAADENPMPDPPADGGPMPDPAAGWDAFMLTTCYAAGRCQADLGCPGTYGCRHVPGGSRDAEYDDEGW